MKEIANIIPGMKTEEPKTGIPFRPHPPSLHRLRMQGSFCFGLKAVSSLPTMCYERGGIICLETTPKIFPPKFLPAMHLF